MDPILARLKDRMTNGEPEQKDPLVVEIVHPLKLSVLEIKAAIKNNPSHPLASDFLMGVQKLPDNQEVTKDLVDLQAIIDNCTVDYKDWIENGTRYREKILGPKLDGTLTPTMSQAEPPRSVKPADAVAEDYNDIEDDDEDDL